ncbi:MAG: hypothetical protein ACI841_002353 [Planctomycetota bacterium]|jgi:hypothetical protein
MFPAILASTCILALITPSARQTTAPPAHERAYVLLDQADPLAAYRELADELFGTTYVKSGPRFDADAEVDALLLQDLVDRLDLDEDVLQRVQTLRPWPTVLPPRIRFVYESIFARGLRVMGEPWKARQVMRDQGVYTDWMLLGPFDNERGAGMSQAGPAEREIDFEAEVPGKERPVRWRTNPCPEHPLGRILLQDVFRPDAQVYAYLATAVYVAQDTDIVLRVGTSSGLSVRLNGQELLTHDKERSFGADQDRVVLPLDTGWNQLLLKSGVEDGNWAITTRFTSLDGEPLVFDTAAASEAGIRIDSSACATPEDRQLRDAGSMLLEAREILSKQTQDAQAQRSLARFHLLADREDRESRFAEAAAQRAFELEPDHLGGQYLLARALYPRGKSRSEMALDPYMQALARVLAKDPHHMRALLAKARLAMDFQHLPELADELTGRALAQNPQCRAALISRAAYLQSRGREVEGELLQKRAYATEEARQLTENALLASLDALAQGDRAQSRALLRAAVVARPMPGVTMNHWLDTLTDEGRAAELLEWTRRLWMASPFSVDRLLESARAAQAALMDERFERIPELTLFDGVEGWLLPDDLVDRALTICPESVRAHRLRARLALRAGDQARAIESLTEVLRLEPGSDMIRRQISLLQNAPEETRFEDLWRRDASDLVSTPLPDDGQNHVIEVLDRTVVYRVYPDGGQSQYEHLVLRPLNLAGLEALDSWPIVYPRSGNLYVHAVNVHRTDGSSERVPTPRRRDSRRGDIAARFFDLPPLAIGDVVDVEYRIDETEADVFGEYFGTRHQFYPDVIDSYAPTRYSELAVISEVDVPIFASVRRGDALEASVEVDEQGLRVQRWIARNLGRPAMESDMPSSVEIAPVVDVSTYASWEEFGRWWWSFIQKEFDTSPAMEQKVAELTSGLTEERDKVAAIYRFVAQEIRYNAWAFGTHGYEPFSASTIFERRFGDCKDKSILIRQMLALVDVDAVPVLIKTGTRQPDEGLDAAMVEHFNHCIAYVTPTAERAGYYLDATADRNPLEYLRYDDQGARVLHISHDQVGLHLIPYAPPSENALERSWDIHLEPDGKARVAMRDDSNGKFGVMLRYRYGGETGDLANKLGAELNNSFGEVEIESVLSSELNDTTTPAWLEAAFNAQDIWISQGDQKSLELGFDPIGLSSSGVEPDADRAWPVVLERPYRLQSTVRYHLPAGSEVIRVPPPIDVVADGLISYSVRVEVEEGVVAIQRTFELQSRRISVDDYAAFRRALQDVRTAEERTIGFKLAEEQSEEAPQGDQR